MLVIVFENVSTLRPCIHVQQNTPNKPNKQSMHKQWNQQIFCMFDTFAAFTVFSSLRIVRTIRSKYDVILKTFLRFCGVIFENFWKNAVKTVKKLLQIFKKYRNN